MKIHNRRAHSLLPILGVGCLLGACEQPPEPTEIEAQQQPLLGPTQFMTRGPYPNDCSTFHVPTHKWDTFRNTILPGIMQDARIVSNSVAFRSCLEQVMVTGNQTMPHDPVTFPWGPYCPPGEPGCQRDDIRDAHWDLVGAGSLSAADRARFYARRVAVEASTPNDILMTCNPSIANPMSGPVWTDNRTAPESFVIPPYFINETYDAWLNRTTNPGAYQRARAARAAEIWHEAIHTHNYHHTNSSNGSAELKQIPHIVGACMRDAMVRAFDLACPACPAGQGAVPTNFQSGACTCVADPASVTPTVTRSWTYPDASAPMIVVDSFGERSLMWRNGTIYQRNRGSNNWVSVANTGAGTGTELYAGGDTLVYRYPEGWIYRRVADGPWLYFGMTAANTMDMDDLGTLYQRFPTTLYRLRAGSSSYEVIGGSSGLVIAGGDQVFATDPNTGDIYRYTGSAWNWTGSASSWLEVDNFGTLHALSANQQAIYRNKGGASWEWIGGSGQRLEASSRFYAKSLGSNDIYRRMPNGNWLYAATCNHFTGGGNVFYCIRTSGSNQVVDVYESE